MPWVGSCNATVLWWILVLTPCVMSWAKWRSKWFLLVLCLTFPLSQLCKTRSPWPSSVTRECKSLRRTSIRRSRSINVSAKMERVYYGLKADWWFLKTRISRRKSWMRPISPNSLCIQEAPKCTMIWSLCTGGTEWRGRLPSMYQNVTPVRG